MKVAVLFPKIFNFPFTYENNIKKKLKPGDFVKAPFGSVELTGVIWPEQQKTKKNFKVRKVSKKINVKSLNNSMIKFISWFSKYNLVPLGMSLKMVLLNKDVVTKSFDKEFGKFKIKKNFNSLILNEEQQKSLSFIRNFGENYNVSVLEGVTGSGKTLVYFERIKDIINQGKQALILLPEIALTDQFRRRFKDFFGVEPAIWHSATTKKSKSIIWKGVAEGKIQIIIGARSSLFLPFKELGIIVVDEEHDSSYKQDEGVCYNARDMAIARASLENIPINLVTSILSIETYNNVANKKYSITKLSKRYKEANLPKVKIINLHNENLEKGFWIAQKTINEVNKYLDNGDQILFFLNRRGYAPFVICRKCGLKFECPNCSVNLNFHKKLQKLLCHHCGYQSILSRQCKVKEKMNSENCDLIFCGPGIERIFLELKKIYPNRKVEMFSSDTLKKSELTNQLISKVEKKEIDILVGTQLLSKGFHFPKLNCIVVVDTDFTSHGYDLRAAEKNIQLYHQLSGRAGRAGSASAIYFQTYTPNDEIILNISKNDPGFFLKQELSLRKEKKLPPFYRLISLIISGKNELSIMKFAVIIKSKLPKIKNINILGPVSAPITKLRKNYRCRILIKYPKNLFIQKYLAESLDKIKILKGIKLEVDVDPVNFS
jgi:primosomal protein N' (replication factor Y)